MRSVTGAIVVMLLAAASVQASYSILEVSGQAGLIDDPGIEFLGPWSSHSSVWVGQGTQESISDWTDTTFDQEYGVTDTSAASGMGATSGYAETTELNVKSGAHAEPAPGYASAVQAGSTQSREFAVPGGGEVGFKLDIQLSADLFTEASGEFAYVDGGGCGVHCRFRLECTGPRLVPGRVAGGRRGRLRAVDPHGHTYGFARLLTGTDRVGENCD